MNQPWLSRADDPLEASATRCTALAKCGRSRSCFLLTRFLWWLAVLDDSGRPWLWCDASRRSLATVVAWTPSAALAALVETSSDCDTLKAPPWRPRCFGFDATDVAEPSTTGIALGPGVGSAFFSVWSPWTGDGVDSSGADVVVVVVSPDDALTRLWRNSTDAVCALRRGATTNRSMLETSGTAVVVVVVDDDAGVLATEWWRAFLRQTLFWRCGCGWFGASVRDQFTVADRGSPLPPVAKRDW